MIDRRERAEAMDRLLIEGLEDSHAVEFVRNYLSAFQLVDDLIDGDTEFDEKSAWMLYELVLYAIPGNLFFLRFSSLLLPVMRVAMIGYECATKVEKQAWQERRAGDFQQDDAHKTYRLVRSAHDVRNNFFDIVPFCVEILHGKEARDVFAPKWFAASRDCELFASYVEKVTADPRPTKKPYIE